MQTQHIRINEVQRKSELGYLKERLDDLQRHDKPTRIINLWGIAGIGKSSVLEQALQTFHNRATVYRVQLSPKQEDSHQEDVNDHQGWNAVLTTLRTVAGLQELQPPAADLGDVPLPSIVGAPGPVGAPVLLLLDDANDFPFWRWLQKDLIKPFVLRQSGIVVLTSHIPLFWELPELKDACEPLPMSTFTKKDIASILLDMGMTNSEVLAETIFTYTKGYPLAVNFFVQQLPNVKDSSLFDLSRLLPETNEALLNGLGVVRLAEVEVIEELKDAWPIGTDIRKAVVAARGELEDRDPPLLVKQGTSTPSILDGRVRRAVKAALEQREPGSYLRFCRKLEEIYYQRAKRSPDKHTPAILEWLYFSLKLLPYDNQALNERWAKRFHELLDRFDQVNKAYKEDDVGEDNQERDNALLYVLFNRDAELIRDVKELDTSYLELLRANPKFNKVADQEASVYEYIERRLSQPLTSPKASLTSSFKVEVDASYRDVVNSLYKRLRGDKLLPAKMRDPSSFEASLSSVFVSTKPGREPTFTLDTLRHQMSVGVGLRAGLKPSEIDQVLSFLGRCGLLVFRREERSYKSNDVLASLGTSAKRGISEMAWLETSRNSPQ